MPPHSPSEEHVASFRADLARLAGDRPGRLGIAVSGGPDSLGLLLLAHSAFPETVEAATVDHKLRPEAADEARFVAEICGRLGVPHSILDVKVDVSKGGLQSAARAERYRALGGWATERSISLLATAHHVEDQAETLMMRLLRGSGAAGLAGVRAVGPFPGRDGVRLIRPLLGWRRDELRRLVEEAGIEPIEDPSNQDEGFDRVRIRRRLVDASWIDQAPLARSAAALAEVDEALTWSAEQVWTDRVSTSDKSISFSADGLPSEITRRLLLRIIASFDAAPTPRGEEVGRMAATLASHGTATLAGVQCRGGDVWTFVREGPRRPRS